MYTNICTTFLSPKNNVSTSQSPWLLLSPGAEARSAVATEQPGNSTHTQYENFGHWPFQETVKAKESSLTTVRYPRVNLI